MKDILFYMIVALAFSIVFWATLVAIDFGRAKAKGYKPRYMWASIPIVWAILTLAGFLIRPETKYLAVLFVMSVIVMIAGLVFWGLSFTLRSQRTKHLLEFMLYIGTVIPCVVIAYSEISVAWYVMRHPGSLDSPDAVVVNFPLAFMLILYANYLSALITILSILTIYFFVVGPTRTRRNIVFWFVMLGMALLSNLLLSEHRIAAVYMRVVFTTAMTVLPIVFAGLLMKMLLTKSDHSDIQRQRAS
jgi:hypothetical protein